MFGGSYFGESPFASPPTVIGTVKKIIKWAAGLPGGLWNAMRARPTWSSGQPTGNIDERGAGADWEADTPRSNIQTPRGLDP